MLDTLIVHTLACYALYHIASRSDVLRRPRQWVLRTLPGSLTYPLNCAFCWTVWLGLLTTVALWLGTGMLILSPTILLAAPALNLVTDLVVKWLLKALEPPLLCVPQYSTTSGGTQATITLGSTPNQGSISIPTVWTPGLNQPQGTTYTWDASIPGTPNFALGPWSGPLPEGWELTLESRPICPRLVGRRVSFSWGPRKGIIEKGYRDDDDCSGSWGQLKIRIKGDDGQTYTDVYAHCTLEGDEPSAGVVTKL